MQVTSLLDMFAIILFFLLISFQAEDKEFILHAGVDLPSSTARSPLKPGVNVAITEDAVYVEGHKVHALQKGGTVTEEELQKGKLERVSRAVALIWRNKDKEEGDDNIVVIQAGQGLPYKTIHLVMRSAAHAGFFRFRLAVDKKSSVSGVGVSRDAEESP